MRVISQDMRNDFPYEAVVIQRIESEIYATFPPYQCVLFAKYSTEEKAIKAMKMLRAFREIRSIENVDCKRYMNEPFFKCLNDYYKIALHGEVDEHLKFDLYKICDYFQFPQDDEIEV